MTKLKRKLFYFAFCICLLALISIGFAEEKQAAILFDFNEAMPESGIIRNKGIAGSVGEVRRNKPSGSIAECFVDFNGHKGFRIGTTSHNCIVIENNENINKVLEGGFYVSFGYTMPKNITSLRPKEHVLTLIAKYDTKGSRSFSIHTDIFGGVVFAVSPDGESSVSISRKIVVPGERVMIEARFEPGKEISLWVDGKSVKKSIAFNSLFQSPTPITVGARLYNNNLINFGEGIIDSVAIMSLSKTENVNNVDDSPVLEPLKTDITVAADYKQAFIRDNGLRGEICLNGIWKWQPQNKVNENSPDEANWLYRKVPADRSTAFAIKNRDGENAGKYHGIKITGKERCWVGTEISIPPEWKDRLIYLEIDGLWGDKPLLVLDGKRMFTSPNLPYKFAVKYSDKPITLRIKADAVKQNVWLRSYPKRTSVRFSSVIPSCRKKELGVIVEGVAAKNETFFSRIVVSETEDFAETVKQSEWKKINLNNNEYGFMFKMPWSDPKLWTPDAPNLYFFKIEIKDDSDKLIDRSLPQRFGFREIWIDKGILKLNGVQVNLRGNNHTPFGSKHSYLEFTGRRENILWNLKKWKEEIHLNSFFVWSQSNQGLSDRSIVLDVADELGLLVIFMLPNGQKDYATNEHVKKYNNRLIRGEVRRYSHHPSLLAWEFSGGHYTWACAPALLDEQYFEPEKYWDKIRLNTEHLLKMKEQVKTLDPMRPILTHSGGHNKVTDAHTGMVYINPDAGLQERSNWPLAWWKNCANMKPLILTEISCPYWATFYHRRTPNSFPSKDSEPLFLEHGAQLFGDRVYMAEPEECVRDFFDKGKAIDVYWRAWDKSPSPAVWDFKTEYLKYAYGAWRAYGVGFFLHTEIRPGYDNRGHPTKSPPLDNCQQPGVFVDNYQTANESVGTKLNKWGRQLQKYLDPFYSFIGGDPLFTAKDHAFYSGEKIVKRAVILNDHFYDMPVDVKWTFIEKSGAVIFEKELSGIVGAGERCLNKYMLSFIAPAVSKRTEYILYLEVKNKADTRTDSFAIEVFPLLKPEAKSEQLNLFDPVGESHSMLDAAGYTLSMIKDRIPEDGIMVIGRHVLENKENVSRLAELGFDEKLKNGLKVIVFEQACENILGLRAYENSPRRTFSTAETHPVLSGIQAEDLWFWRGESDLIKSWPKMPRKVPTYAGGWFPERFWKWGNDGNVATYVIQKPMAGAFRALINSGFDLMDAVLLESCIGRGRILFCQLDVTSRYGEDPTATKMVDNIIRYMAEVEMPDSTLTEINYEKGRDIFEGYRMRKPKGKLGWGLNDGDFYFRQKVTFPAYALGDNASIVKWENDKKNRVACSVSINDLQNNWQKYKLYKIQSALRMNQGGSSDVGVGVALHGDKYTLYPLNWHIGYVHPYTGWCW